jgi:hypothetical protein
MKKIFTLILSLALVQAFGQTPAVVMQVVSSSGGYYATTNLSISWTLGEPVTTTLSGSSIILTQGFQQGNLFATNVTNPELSSTDFKMYPNPAISKVYFEVNNKNAKGDFIVEVYDITGRKIIHENLGVFNQELKDLNVSSLKSGIYLVKVTIGSFNGDVIKLIKE